MRGRDSEKYHMWTRDEETTREQFQYVTMTRSTCFECVKAHPGEIRLVDAEIFTKDGKTYMKKHCPEHGVSYALKNSDADWFFQSMQQGNMRPGACIDEYQTDEKSGCPYDCGLCPTHHQHTCIAVADIIGKCDMGCPVCDAQAVKTSPYEMSLEQFKGVIDMVIRANREVQAIALSGGEPALHPQLFDFIEAALERDEVRRIDFLTGGIRISRDEKFVEQIAKYNPHVYVNLAFDGFKSDPYLYIRGKDYLEMKLKAMERLKEYNINTILQTIIARGKNEDQVGKIILDYVREPHIRGFIFQPLIWAYGAPDDIVDPLDRVTLPDISKAMEEQTNGLLTRDDFLFPCPHPECMLMTYVHVGKKRVRSIPSVIPKKELLDAIHTEPLMRPQRAFKMLFERGKEPPAKPEYRDRDELSEFEKKSKFINVHHYMDAHDLDTSRLRKCCQHMPTLDNRLIPVCLTNLFYRHVDRRWK